MGRHSGDRPTRPGGPWTTERPWRTWARPSGRWAGDGRRTWVHLRCCNYAAINLGQPPTAPARCIRLAKGSASRRVGERTGCRFARHGRWGGGCARLGFEGGLRERGPECRARSSSSGQRGNDKKNAAFSNRGDLRPVARFLDEGGEAQSGYENGRGRAGRSGKVGRIPFHGANAGAAIAGRRALTDVLAGARQQAQSPRRPRVLAQLPSRAPLGLHFGCILTNGTRRKRNAR